jgi:hypothetical protein
MIGNRNGDLPHCRAGFQLADPRRAFIDFCCSFRNQLTWWKCNAKLKELDNITNWIWDPYRYAPFHVLLVSEWQMPLQLHCHKTYCSGDEHLWINRMPNLNWRWILTCVIIVIVVLEIAKLSCTTTMNLAPVVLVLLCLFSVVCKKAGPRND